MTDAAWIAARDTTAFGPHGLASLAATRWLSPASSVSPDVPGAWRVDHGVAVGLIDGAEVRLSPGEDHPHGSLLLRAFAREDALAIRVLDPRRAAHAGLREIERFAQDPAARAVGCFTAARVGPVPTLAVDGHVSSTVYDGVVSFELDGVPLELLVHRDGDQLFGAFEDATVATEPYGFRMIRLAGPHADGGVTVDLNRAYLPPSRFSPHFVCVTPPPRNRWPVAVLAGERRIVPRDRS
ncbi:DUF1684 domain-containing protein [Demequina gelatinilytica]|uniref:DUF1684 domain-containing protein n=1 Tax=Demequina gelatinilytica TaxID=1638980 RepID=UPI00078044ED|nr:DUF1684 domain-containing protein [Demequina gelatinilytica]